MIDISINKIFTLLTGLSVAGASMVPLHSQSHRANDTDQKVREAIETYVSAGDQRDAAKLDSILHQHFRVVANQLMGSSTVNVITKEQYIGLVKDGKLGGDSRSIEIITLEIVNKNASARVRLKGKALSFDTFYQFIQSPEGHWQLVQDLPYATKIQER